MLAAPPTPGLSEAACLGHKRSTWGEGVCATPSLSLSMSSCPQSSSQGSPQCCCSPSILHPQCTHRLLFNTAFSPVSLGPFPCCAQDGKLCPGRTFFDFLDIILSPSQTIEKTEFHGCWCSNRTTSPGLLEDIVQPRTLSAQLACLPWPSSPQIPEAWLLLANVVVILILVPVKDHLIDPLLLQCKLLPSALKKMALGMFFGFTSIIVAGA